MTITLDSSQKPVVTVPEPPQSGLLGRLSVGQKLLLAGLTLAIPASLLLVNSLNSQRNQANQLQKQLTGQSYLEPLAQTQYGLRSARVPALGFLNGDPASLTSFKERAERTLHNIDQAIAVAQATGNSEAATQLKKIRSAFDSLYQTTLKKGLNSKAYTDANNKILNGQLAPLFTSVANKYRMNFVQDDQSRNLVQMTTLTLASRLPQIGASFAEGINAATAAEKQGGKLTDIQRLTLDFTVRNGEAAQKEIQSAVETITGQNQNVSPDLKAKFDQLAQATAKDFTLLRTNLVQSPTANLKPAQVRQYANDYLPVQYAAYTAANSEIGNVLRARLARTNQRFLELLLFSLVIALLVGRLLYAIARSITRPLGTLTSAAQRLAQGNYDVQTPVTTNDEIGTLSNSFNAAAAQLRANAERGALERAEAQRLQQNIGEFLNVTMDIAEGDLTQRGKVTEDVLGNVVDSINLMAEELADTLKDVQHASQSVTSGSQAMLGTTEQIERGAASTTEQARRVAQQAQDVNARIQEMARAAQVSAETARQALLASQQGQEAVTSTLSGMAEIRSSSQSVAGRIQSLAQRSEQIQEIVDSISHIASQTNLLSLHASIEAAGAGEAGNRFAIVADEVRRLADESTQATQSIAQVISSVQAEIRDVAQSIRLSTQQVEQGYEVAGQAGERLRQIGQLSEESAKLAAEISNAATEQVRGVQDMGQGVQQIAQIAEQSQQSVQQSRSAAEHLQGLAQQLSQSLTRFKLPS
ncbi:methyl-accepting chemotaxis protein [Deinococcus sp.]|uniref:methyl-accepting chemotaxis protein n=1 Tax=Deinococcus sp. TaxID=47478 RepID=UPI0025C01F8B|nr:methyl-accepting chemotaxis protein [Deinococcus sp.]